MDTLIAILLNVVYGILFFLAFGVLIGTTGLFALATWDVIGRRMWQRLRGSKQTPA
jgi:hypothetical protein